MTTVELKLRLVLGPPPTDPEFRPQDAGWNKLREPDPILLQLIAIPIAGVVGIVLAAFWLLLAPRTPLSSLAKHPHASTMWLAVVGDLFAFALGLAALIPVHEVIHALGYQGGLRSKQVLIGLWPAKLLAYAHYLGPISRNRMLLVAILPFLVITLIPMLLAGVLRETYLSVIGLSFINGLCASGDLIIIAILAWQLSELRLARRANLEKSRAKMFDDFEKT